MTAYRDAREGRMQRLEEENAALKAELARHQQAPVSREPACDAPTPAESLHRELRWLIARAVVTSIGLMVSALMCAVMWARYYWR